MTARRVRIYGIDYWPDKTGIAPYTTAFAEYLAAKGDCVEVVAGMPYYPEWRVRADYSRKLRLIETRHGVTIHRRRQYVPRQQSAPRRAGYEVSFLAHSMFDQMVKPDLVIGVSPALSDGVLAARAARRYGVPMTLWMQDLLGQSAVQSGVSGGRRIAKGTASLEAWVARQATAIAIVAEGFRQPLVQSHVAPERIHRVWNWTHIKPPTEGVAKTRAALGLPQDRTVCLHAGNMGLKQGLENVIACAQLATVHAPHLYFVLMGGGSQRAMLETRAQGLENVKFLDPVDDELFPNVLHAADILLINQRGSVVDMSLPSKLTSYLVVDRPVLAAVHSKSETALAIEEGGAGTVLEPDRPDLLLEGLTAVASGPVADRTMRERAVSALSMPFAVNVLAHVLDASLGAS